MAIWPSGVCRHVGICSLQHARTRAGISRGGGHARGVFAQRRAAASGFHAQHFHVRVIQKRVKQSNRIRAAADAGHQQIRQTLFRFQNLRARFVADHAMKIAHHHRIGMRSQHRAQQIMRRADVRDPVAHRFVDGVLQRARAGIHAHHFRAQHSHAKNIEPLALHVVGAHVDDAFEAQPRRNGGRRHSVLPRAGFRDDAALAHAHGQQSLADAIVDFVRAGVQQIFALDIDARTAQMLRQPRSKLQRRGTPGKILEQVVEFRLEAGIWRAAS